jgi:glycerol-3-phosphate dehydrogenase
MSGTSDKKISSDLKELDPTDADAKVILNALRDKSAVKPVITRPPPLQGDMRSHITDFM